ncbi:hypothetical protein [Mycolicibacter arupensis]|jgi:hypothetical protein|uniref:Head-to-tail stopper n=1 Tax=Mycolicibacter arupensis TaxID=342002 RepID=A0A5C7XY30_9MYCO|nr:hypothetical protein [Mycolicibacter arupensis]MCV7277090.1 hypothetical protein [Mycolicibacter arupensis]TXI54442.1 MAG: hypothetical protein E6Q54_14665 [Mycolicibacter arupensis]
MGDSVNGFGETVTITGVSRDGSGDTSRRRGTVDDTEFGEATEVYLDDHRGRRAVIERSWFCPRTENVGVVAGDRITRANGEVYSVWAGPFGDNPHPISGRELGQKVYRIRSVQAPPRG